MVELRGRRGRAWRRRRPECTAAVRVSEALAGFSAASGGAAAGGCSGAGAARRGRRRAAAGAEPGGPTFAGDPRAAPGDREIPTADAGQGEESEPAPAPASTRRLQGLPDEARAPAARRNGGRRPEPRLRVAPRGVIGRHQRRALTAGWRGGCAETPERRTAVSRNPRRTSGCRAPSVPANEYRAMPHARAAEAAGLASMVPHVRVGMSEALGRPLEGLRAASTRFPIARWGTTLAD